jgi:hypothetical protein
MSLFNKYTMMYVVTAVENKHTYARGHRGKPDSPVTSTDTARTARKNRQ